MSDNIRQRIAALKLYKFFNNVTVNVAASRLPCDLIVESNNSSLKFGVKVTAATPLKTQTFNNYVNSLSGKTFSEINMPIIIAAVNEETEEVRIAPLLSIRLHSIRLYKNPSFQVLNPNTAALVWDNISSMDTVIRMLNNSNLGVLKRIDISISRENQPTLRAFVIYLRSFSPEYKMRTPEIIDEKERFERLLKGIPEDEYPEDILDKIIQAGINIAYPTADVECHSSLLLFNTELDNLRRTLQPCGESFDLTIQVEPQIDKFFENGRPDFTAYRVTTPLYVENRFMRQQWSNWVQPVSLDEDDWAEWDSKVPNILTTKKNISEIVL